MPPKSGRINDNWQTPIEALQPLFPFIKKEWLIWECAQGKKYLVNGLLNKGFEVTGSDILTGQDFLSWQPDKFDCIVTNPPFSLKQQFLERCYRLKKPFALLMPLTTFESARRQSLFYQYGVEVILFPFRINFENESSKVSRAYFISAWFTNGLNIGQQLTFWQPKPAQNGML